MTNSIYNEYLNKYYNPNDDNKKPGDNDNWKSIQKGFHLIGSTQLETTEGLTIDKGSENEESLSGTELKHIKTALENISDDYHDLVEDVADLKSAFLLQAEEISGTTQTIAFDASGNVQCITHTDIMTCNVVRTDTFTFTAGTITEVRTLDSGESLTIATDTTTLETTVTYTAA